MPNANVATVLGVVFVVALVVRVLVDRTYVGIIAKNTSCTGEVRNIHEVRLYRRWRLGLDVGACVAGLAVLVATFVSLA